jgi:lipopolysaccharide/colanic/teichoic acid biosynthesis glycosyltransferase
MSLVGPRPLVVEEDQRVEGWYRRRLELMPGMTGRWQIRSLWTDIKILLRTVPYVIARRRL